MTSQKPANVTANDIRDALRNKHTPSDNVTPPDWVLIEEARSGPGSDGNRGQCDLLAINLYQSRGMHLIGYEIKVSTSDMRAELKQPDKAERFARYCRTWWVVTTPKVWEATQHEIPPSLGSDDLGHPRRPSSEEADTRPPRTRSGPRLVVGRLAGANLPGRPHGDAPRRRHQSAGSTGSGPGPALPT